MDNDDTATRRVTCAVTYCECCDDPVVVERGVSKSVMTVKLEMASLVDDDEAEGRQSLFDQWGAVGPAGR